ncbi:MAG TPA: YciI family protein [Acidimicrobiales bacterium]|nr:YciI family protein [Acidimicrobiales bacterium]
MRSMILIRMDPATAGPPHPDDQMMKDMENLLEEMTKAGVLLDTAGLRPIEEATRVRLSGGKQTVTDGPFTESKEIIGGYCILQTRTKEEAVEWASRFLSIHGPQWEIEVEVRGVVEPDF